MTILPWTKWTNMLKNPIKIYCTYFSGRRSHCISLPGTLNGHWVITSTSCGGVISPWRAIINSCSWILKLDYGKQTVGISGRPLSLFQGPLCLAIQFFWQKKVRKYHYSLRVNWFCRKNDDFGLQLRQVDRSQVTKLLF